MQESLKTLHHKIIQATKRRMRRCAASSSGRADSRSQRHPQERGSTHLRAQSLRPGLVDRLIEALPPDSGTHYVPTL